MNQERRDTDAADGKAAAGTTSQAGNTPVKELLDAGLAHHKAGRLAEAEALYARVLEARPDSSDALHLLGVIAHQAGRHADAVDSIRRAIDVAPGVGDYHSNLGLVLLAQGKREEAIAAFERAIDLAPDLAEAHFNLGNALQGQGRLEEAVSAFERAAGIAPNFARAWSEMGTAFREQGKFDEAIAAYGRAVEIEPTAVARIKFATVLPVVAESEAAVLSARRRFEENLDALLAAGISLNDPMKEIGLTNFYLAYQGLDDRELQEKTARLFERACPSLVWTAPHCERPPAGEPPGRLRIGFVSRFLSGHTIGKLNRGLIENLSRDRFETVVFRPPGEENEATTAIDGAADSVVRVPDNLEAARAVIAAEKPDVLYFTDIGMEPLSYFLAFARLAPVQCATWGHPVTTGIPNVDYFISSRLMEPEGADAHYSERLIRFDSLTVFYHRPEAPHPPPGRERFGLPEDRRLYVCPQSLFKFHPDFDGILGELLRRDPKGVLVLVAGRQAHWQKMLRDRFGRSFPDAADRVRFLPRMSGEDFFALLAVADVLLDTPFFCGGNTTFESFAVGAPVVTLPGPFLKGRLTLAFYKRMGVMDCVAESAESYVDIALRLANDREWRERVVARIAAARDPLYEDMEAVREMERFFERSVAAARTGERLAEWNG